MKLNGEEVKKNNSKVKTIEYYEKKNTNLPGMEEIENKIIMQENQNCVPQVKRPKDVNDILLQSFKERATQIIDVLEKEANALITNKTFSTNNNESQLESIRIDLLTTKANLINLEVYE